MNIGNIRPNVGGKSTRRQHALTLTELLLLIVLLAILGALVLPHGGSYRISEVAKSDIAKFTTAT